MKRWIVSCLLVWMTLTLNLVAAPLNLSQSPLFLTNAVPPLTMLVLSRDHRLYEEAYKDGTDINGDGIINLGFDPAIDYYGYFDSYKCYSYDSGGQLFLPVSVSLSKTCSGQWSGNFLNYLTTARLDAIRKVLYGGYRAIDNANYTVLQRTYIPQDSHSWGTDYNSTSSNGYNISQYTPFAAPGGASNYHMFANTTLRNGSGAPILRVAIDQPYRIWQWVNSERPVVSSEVQVGNSRVALGGIQDFVIRVRVCDSTIGLESNCQTYPDGFTKPVGLLQTYGENNSMYFGLLTGSYANNLNGGVLRKNISSINDEINTTTGQFSSVNGIIATLNKLTVVGFQSDYTYRCGWITDRNIINGECSMWGNPVGEMMYESLRYFAGKGSPTASFSNTGAGTPDALLGLPAPGWQNPYNNYPRCAQANMLVISDLNPSYDSDQVPGSAFNAFTGDVSGLNAASLAQSIFTSEGFSSVLAFIGQSGSNYDGAPTPKTVSSFGNIRGLSPFESNSEGSFYSAAVAYFSRITDVSAAPGTQNIKSYILGLSSAMPEFKFNVGGQTISVVPFGKSVGSIGETYPIDPSEGAFQPNNTIVDYYIETLSATQAVVRVFFEGVQQGADYDMDAYVRYEITVNADNTLSVSLSSEYAASSIIQHLGYVISGSTQDGVYLVVRDADTPETSDINYFHDTPVGENPGGNWNTGVALPLVDSRVFSPSSAGSAINFQSPLWYAAKWGGFTDTNNNNQLDRTEEWDSNLDGVPDSFFLVNNAANLFDQLNKALSKIIDQTGSFSSAALSSGFLASDTLIYQAIFRTKDWSGQLLAYPIDQTNGDIITTGTGPNGSLWDAAQLLGISNFNTGRQIISYNPVSVRGVPFRWPANPAAPTNSEINLAQVNFLNTSPVTALIDGLGAQRLDYLRGNRALEQKNGGTFRNRLTVLGDIIDSNPAVIGAPIAPYPFIWADGAPENTIAYTTFKNNNLNRQSIIYVSANDGMLHGFDAKLGNEVFAYVPAAVYRYLNQLSDPNYNHRYYVNGSPTVTDALLGGNWKTILVGNLRGGGQGMYALDVTVPSDLRESNAANVVKWEFTDANDADMGFSYSQAAIVRLNNGNWAAVFGNGYNNTVADGTASTTGNAVLYIVNLNTGAIIKKFDTGQGMTQDPLGQGRPNGMSTPVMVDIDGNSIADYIYVGDLFGNLWKIDISSANPSQWDFSYKQGSSPRPFFIAQDANGNRQAITSRPTVSRLSYSAYGIQIYFGTGKYLEDSDKTDLSVQTVYALRDNNSGLITGRSQLREQSILAEVGNTRAVSQNMLANNDRGWYLDLIVNNQARGERVISDIIFLSGKVIFSTVIPTSDPCDFGGESWLMELNAANGARLNYNVFDINNDGQFDSGDSTNIGTGGTTTLVPTSGLKSEVGLVATPAILSAGNVEYKYMPGTSGGIQKVTENPGEQIFGRQSWRQLR